METFVKDGSTQCRDCWLTSSYHTVRVVFLKYVAIQLPVAVVSGLLYLQMIRTLQQGKTNPQKRRLTYAFAFLWTSWVLCNLPTAIVEVLESLNDDLILIESLSDVQFMLALGLGDREGLVKAYLIKNLLFGVKLSYGFLNSLLLVILYRPFREPMKRCLKFIKSLYFF